MPIKDPPRCSSCGKGLVTIPRRGGLERKKLPLYACSACDVYGQWPRYKLYKRGEE